MSITGDHHTILRGMRVSNVDHAAQIASLLPAPVLKLSGFEPLDTDDKDAMRAAISDRVSVGRHQRIAASSAGMKVAISSGIAGDCRTFQDGKRHIIRLFMAGDFLPEGALAQTIFSLGPLETIQFSGSTDAWVRPAIARALHQARDFDDALFYRWVATLGGRPAELKIGHLLQEIYWRLNRIGQASGLQFRLSFTQQDLADVTGLSLVHTNKSLKRLARTDILRMRAGTVEICDPEALGGLTEFDPEASFQAGLSHSDHVTTASPFSLASICVRERSTLGIS